MKRFFALIFLLLLSCSYAEGRTSSSDLRVISLYPGHSDNIAALGGQNILIALSENDDADLLPMLPRLSMRDGAEKFLALKPGIVVTRSFAQRINPNLYEVLERAGVKIISIDPPKWDNFENYLMTLAEALGLDAQPALKKLHDIKNSVAPSLKKKPYCFIEATSKEIHTCAPGSWAANLISLAGGINAAAEAKPLRNGSAVASWGAERVLKSHENKNLDIYIIQTGAMNNATVKDFYSREWTAALKGVKVYEVPERFLSRPSLTGLEKGLNILKKIITEEK